jgi:hypothetical protein
MLPAGANNMVVFASDAANARAIAAGHFEGDSQAAWNAATAVQIVAADDFSDSKWSLRIKVLDATTPISIQANGGVSGVVTVAVNDGGIATYIVGDVMTLSGGTFSRAATFRVTTVSTGVITGLEVIDPGEYTVNTGLTAVALTGGSGGGSPTADVTYGTNQYMNFLAEAVGLLNADAQIAGAAANVEDSAGTPNFTIAETTDTLGDKDAVVEFMYGESPVAEMVGAVTDGGAAGAALSFLMPTSFALVSVARALKS